MMVMAAGGNLVDLGRFSSGVSANQACSLSPQPSPPSLPNSSVWLSPAEYPSAEIESSQITLPIPLVNALSSS